MKQTAAERIANAILYEGYILYPYRASALKNRSRWNFGGLCPRAYSEAQGGTEHWRSQTECLIEGSNQTTLHVQVRFLHLVNREVARIRDCAGAREDPSGAYEIVDRLELGGRLFQTWQEAKEREVQLPEMTLGNPAECMPSTFHCPEWRDVELLRDSHGRIGGALIRTQQPLDGAVCVAVTCVGDGLFKVRLEISNLMAFVETSQVRREQAMMHSLVSSHAILGVDRGEFVSLLDPPAKYAERAAECQNTTLYPVLVGPDGPHSTMLASPIILYDYPKVADESAGDLFDGAEIDEILTLRIMALSEAEKAEMRQCDERAREILERVESAPGHLAALHGSMRPVAQPKGRMP